MISKRHDPKKIPHPPQILSLIPLAHHEFLQAAQKHQEKIWGYFPSLNKPSDLPHSILLSQALTQWIHQSIDPYWTFAFLRTSLPRKEEQEGHLHLDSQPDGRPVAQEKEGRQKEIWRLLVNLHDSPRRLRYSSMDREEIAKRGGSLEQKGYILVKLPPSAFLEEIEIPPRDKGGFWALEFCASHTPHAGVEGVKGHFLAAFGRNK